MKDADYEVLNQKELKKAINLLVDFAEKQKMNPKMVLAAMDHIVTKIKEHYGIEILSSDAESSKSLH